MAYMLIILIIQFNLINTYDTLKRGNNKLQFYALNCNIQMYDLFPPTENVISIPFTLPRLLKKIKS